MVRNEIRFGRNLRILRSQNGVSQQELADAIHMTRQTLSTWERGAGKPDIYYVHDVCKYFDVPIETMLYGNILSDDIEVETEELFEYGYYIKNFNKQGFYTIIDEDLEEFFGIIRHDLEHIAVTALALHNKGYVVSEVFDNGFSVYLKSDKEAVQFQSDLYDILDCFIHHDNIYIEDKRRELGDIIGAAHNEVLNNVMKEILGADVSTFAFYWVDEMENPRGYANSEEECKQQADAQQCANYTILPMV